MHRIVGTRSIGFMFGNAKSIVFESVFNEH
jgi:hypothetical protein